MSGLAGDLAALLPAGKMREMLARAATRDLRESDRFLAALVEEGARESAAELAVIGIDPENPLTLIAAAAILDAWAPSAPSAAAALLEAFEGRGDDVPSV